MDFSAVGRSSGNVLIAWTSDGLFQQVNVELWAKYQALTAWLLQAHRLLQTFRINVPACCRQHFLWSLYYHITTLAIGLVHMWDTLGKILQDVFFHCKVFVEWFSRSPIQLMNAVQWEGIKGYVLIKYTEVFGGKKHKRENSRKMLNNCVPTSICIKMISYQIRLASRMKTAREFVNHKRPNLPS